MLPTTISLAIFDHQDDRGDKNPPTISLKKLGEQW